jgi:hypothetical protein
MLDNFTSVWFYEGAILRATNRMERPFEVKWDHRYAYAPIGMGDVARFVQEAGKYCRRVRVSPPILTV